MDGPSVSSEIERHKSAISRTDLSRPVRLALETGLLDSASTLFDFGCGRGGDVERLLRLGVTAQGWDPFYRPDTQKIPSDVVNLGYVLNVIEAEHERRTTLREAWSLTQKALVVAAQTTFDRKSDVAAEYSDGIVTSRQTFQKYFEQDELKQYIESSLEVDAVPLALGVFVVFRDSAAAESFRASRIRSRITIPRIKLPTRKFEDFVDILNPLMAFMTERGRLPAVGELSSEDPIRANFGSIRQAWKFVLKSTDSSEWEEISAKRRLDLLLYLALTTFTKRPRLSLLPQFMQNDFRAFFLSYRDACRIADQMLFSLGLPGVIQHCARSSLVGKLLPDALYVHVSALSSVDPLLRLYEGCASRTVGRMNDTTLVKFHISEPKISYLEYPTFDAHPHPALKTSMQIDLRDLHIKYFDYDLRDNPPILHRKETFVMPDYPNHDIFANLTASEERLGLLENPKSIGTLLGWKRRLQEKNVHLEGHQVVSS